MAGWGVVVGGLTSSLVSPGVAVVCPLSYEAIRRSSSAVHSLSTSSPNALSTQLAAQSTGQPAAFHDAVTLYTQAVEQDRIRGAVMYDEIAPDRGLDPADIEVASELLGPDGARSLERLAELRRLSPRTGPVI